MKMASKVRIRMSIGNKTSGSSAEAERIQRVKELVGFLVCCYWPFQADPGK